MNKRKISKILGESVFSPNKPGPMKILVDIGNIEYYLNRVIEDLLELKEDFLDKVVWDSTLKRNISLLALVRAKLDEN